ncbi:MAG: hypothetical protein WB626_12645 [Bacteroidota bacterium]
MCATLSTEVLEARLTEIERERELLLQLIAIRKGESGGETGALAVSVSPPRPGSNTIRGRVVDATIELIHRMGRHVTNEEVLKFAVEEKGISLGDNKDKARALGAILSQECDKKSARLKRAARGVYDLK